MDGKAKPADPCGVGDPGGLFRRSRSGEAAPSVGATTGRRYGISSCCCSAPSFSTGIKSALLTPSANAAELAT